MIDIDGLMELFGEMQKAGIENLRIAMDDKNGMKFNLVITPPARCVAVQPEPVKAPEAVKEPEQEKAAEAVKTTPEPEKKSFSNEELKKVLEEAVKKPGRGGRPKEEAPAGTDRSGVQDHLIRGDRGEALTAACGRQSIEQKLNEIESRMPSTGRVLRNGSRNEEGS